MFLWIARILVVAAGPIVGYYQISSDGKGIIIGTVVAVGVLFIEWIIEKVPLDDMIAAFIGVIVGLIMAKLVDYLIVVTFSEPIVEGWAKYSLLVKIVFGYVGMVLAVRKKGEMHLLDQNISFTSKHLIPESIILDTSVLIDGRILEIAKTNFIVPVVIIPRFVLNEMHKLSDSSDEAKRSKGRRGLDVAKKLEDPESGVKVKIYENDYPEIASTDEKLIKCASDLKSRIMTNDFNLAKVAEIRGVKVLNINALAKALKPEVLPGEVIEVFLLKEGKEHRQAVGYLDDGTMVVVENARGFIGQAKKVVVVNTIQTDAGRIIFTKLENDTR